MGKSRLSAEPKSWRRRRAAQNCTGLPPCTRSVSRRSKERRSGRTRRHGNDSQCLRGRPLPMRNIDRSTAAEHGNNGPIRSSSTPMITSSLSSVSTMRSESMRIGNSYPDTSRSVCNLLSELEGDILRGSQDVVAGFGKNTTSGSKGCAQGNYTIVLWHTDPDPNNERFAEWTTQQHETSHTFGAPDRYPDPNNLHPNDVMEDQYHYYNVLVHQGWIQRLGNCQLPCQQVSLSGGRSGSLPEVP